MSISEALLVRGQTILPPSAQEFVKRTVVGQSVVVKRIEHDSIAPPSDVLRLAIGEGVVQPTVEIADDMSKTAAIDADVDSALQAIDADRIEYLSVREAEKFWNS